MRVPLSFLRTAGARGFHTSQQLAGLRGAAAFSQGIPGSEPNLEADALFEIRRIVVETAASGGHEHTPVMLDYLAREHLRQAYPNNTPKEVMEAAGNALTAYQDELNLDSKQPQRPASVLGIFAAAAVQAITRPFSQGYKP